MKHKVQPCTRPVPRLSPWGLWSAHRPPVQFLWPLPHIAASVAACACEAGPPVGPGAPQFCWGACAGDHLLPAVDRLKTWPTCNRAWRTLVGGTRGQPLYGPWCTALVACSYTVTEKRTPRAGPPQIAVLRQPLVPPIRRPMLLQIIKRTAHTTARARAFDCKERAPRLPKKKKFVSRRHSSSF